MSVTDFPRMPLFLASLAWLSRFGEACKKA